MTRLEDQDQEQEQHCSLILPPFPPAPLVISPKLQKNNYNR